MTKDWWTTQELAQAADVTDAYIRYLLLNDQLQGDKFGRAWRIRDAEAQRFLEQRGIYKKRD